MNGLKFLLICELKLNSLKENKFLPEYIFERKRNFCGTFYIYVQVSPKYPEKFIFNNVY